MMRQSLPGLFKNTARGLQSSTDDLACVCAFSLGELIDNLRVLKNGGCTVAEFFEVYVFDSTSERKLAEQVHSKDYRCFQDDPEDEAAP